MSKKIKYRPIKQEETIDISVAFSQAAALLDQAAKKAIDENDSIQLLEVADRWITIGSLFAQSEDPKEHLDTNDKSQYGFSPFQEGVEDEDE